MKICVTSGFCAMCGNVRNAHQPVNAMSGYLCNERKPGACVS